MSETLLVSALLAGAVVAAEPAAPVRLDDQQLDRVTAGLQSGGLQGTVQWFTSSVGKLTFALPTKTLEALLQPQDPI